MSITLSPNRHGDMSLNDGGFAAIKREIFRRGVRFQHQFGTLEERNDPWGTRTFDPRFPERVDELSKHGHACEIQDYGEHFYALERSAVVKPTGEAASLNGPVPDIAEQLGRPIPVGTKRRIGPPRTDK